MSTNELDLVVARDVAVPMRDGTLLRADIFRPSNSTDSPAPTILVRTTYDKQRAQDTRDAEGFARSGYVFVIQAGGFERWWGVDVEPPTFLAPIDGDAPTPGVAPGGGPAAPSPSVNP